MDYSLISLTEISLKCHTTFGYKKITFNFGKGEGLKTPIVVSDLFGLLRRESLLHPPLKREVAPLERGLVFYYLWSFESPQADTNLLAEIIIT
jgi:hypothetical protein